MLRLGERRDVVFVPRPTDAASLAFLLLGVAAFAAAVASALRNDGLNAPRDGREGAFVPKESGGEAGLGAAFFAVSRIFFIREREGRVVLMVLVDAPLDDPYLVRGDLGGRALLLLLGVGVRLTAILILPMNNYMFTRRGCGQKGLNVRRTKKPHPYIKYSIEPIIPTVFIRKERTKEKKFL